MYKLYTDFNTKYKTELKNYINSQYKQSLKYLSENIEPIKYRITNNVKNKKSKLRSIDKGDINYVIQYEGSENWISEPLSELRIRFTKRYDINKKDLTDYISTKKLKKCLKKLNDMDNYDYTELLNILRHNHITLSKLIEMAKYKNTPFPDIKRVYSKIFGVIENKS